MSFADILDIAQALAPVAVAMAGAYAAIYALADLPRGRPRRPGEDKTMALKVEVDEGGDMWLSIQGVVPLANRPDALAAAGCLVAVVDGFRGGRRNARLVRGDDSGARMRVSRVDIVRPGGGDLAVRIEVADDASRREADAIRAAVEGLSRFVAAGAAAEVKFGLGDAPRETIWLKNDGQVCEASADRAMREIVSRIWLLDDDRRRRLIELLGGD